MLPPVKFNMLGQMQLRGNGGGSSSTTTTTATSTSPSCISSPIKAESKSPNGSSISSKSRKTSTPTSSSSSTSSSISLSPQAVVGDSSTLPIHGSSKKENNGSMLANGTGISLTFGSNSEHQINSALAWQLANSSQSIDHQDTRSNNQNGCRGAGDGVAVGGLNFDVNALTNTGHHHHQLNRKAYSASSLSSSTFHFQQQHGVSQDSPHHQHHKNTKNRDEKGDTSKTDEIEEDSSEETETGAGVRSESPLDFSTKKKFKGEPSLVKNKIIELCAQDQISLTRESSNSPCSRLRNILSMKSPTIPDEMAGTVLNLSKESPTLSSIWVKTESPSHSNNNSNSSSPILRGSGTNEHATAFVQSNSPRPATIPISMGAPTVLVPPVGGLGSNGSSGGGSGSSSNETSSVGLPSWGSGVYSPSISPIMSHTVPANGAALPLSFETSPTLFSHHIAAGTGSPSLPFPQSLSIPLSNNVSTTGSKGRATRPFKAYPKDPLTFSSVGLYGLPLGTAPGTTEAVIHQQSNQAYAEFRKQMLSSSQFGKARRSGHRNSPYPIPDSVDGHTSDGGSMMRANDSGSASDDGNSFTNGKIRLGKSEQQMKDEAYWERRRKNNEAAKRSRDARRAKEDEIAIRAAFLEQENLKLRFEVCALKSETAKLRCMLYSS